MYNTIKRIYEKNGDAEVVNKAFSKGWITAEQKAEILGE